MAISKKSFVNLDLQGNSLVNPTIGLNSNMTKEGSFQYNAAEFRLEYFNGTLVEQVANLTDIAAVTGGLIFQGGYDPTTNTPDITVDNGTVLKGYFWVATAAGTFLGETVQVGDSIIAKQDNPGTTAANWLILQGNVVIATDTVDGIVRLATQEEVNAGTEGGAVVLTPATFAASQQLADINTDITNLENDKLARDGSQAVTGNFNWDGYSISNIDTISGGSKPVTMPTGIESLPAPVNDGDAANKTYVDTAAATAESNANTYTDTQIAAQSYGATITTSDWNGTALDGYYFTVNHGLNSSYLTYSIFDVANNQYVEVGVQQVGLNSSQINVNNLPINDLIVSFVKSGGSL